jgi:sarcosine oxidase subunit beta
MPNNYDAIVIGAGVVGAAVGYELAKKGMKTLNLDKLPAAGYGSTGASCAIIRTFYSTIDGCAFAYEGVHYWRHWAEYLGVEDERGFAKYHETGVLVLTAGNGNRLDLIRLNMAAVGVTIEEWDAKTLKEKLPIYDLHCYAPAKRPEDPGFGEPTGGEIEGAVYFPDGGYISDPQLATHNLQRAAEAAGGDFRFNAEVAAVRQEKGRVAGVTLKDGVAIDAPVVVNVAGPHSARINDLAGVAEGMKIKTRALRHEVAHVPSPKGFDFEKDGFVISDSDIGCYTRPEIGNHILIGSEDPECDTREWVDPDDCNREFSEQWTVQVQRAGQRIPTLGIPNQAKGVVDLYDVSDDWIPIYDKSDLPGFYLAVGTSGNQFKNAPVAGAMMAELIEACEAGRDHDADPLQFALKHTGRTIDVGFYSRLREVNRESSFSVLG